MWFFFIFWLLSSINSIDVKIAKNALRLMETASAAHPCALWNIMPYKGKHNIYLFSMVYVTVEFPIQECVELFQVLFPRHCIERLQKKECLGVVMDVLRKVAKCTV